MTKVIIWRESVWKSDMCPMCRTKARNEEGNPTEEVRQDITGSMLFCTRCGTILAFLKEDSRSYEELLEKQRKSKGYWGEKLT